MAKWIVTALAVVAVASAGLAKTFVLIPPTPCEAYFKVYTQQNLAPASEQYSPIGGDVYPVLYIRLGAASRIPDGAPTALEVRVQDLHQAHIDPQTGQRDPDTIAVLDTINLAAASGWEMLVNGTWTAAGTPPAAYNNQYGTEKVLFRHRVGEAWNTRTVPMGHNGRHDLTASTAVQFASYDGQEWSSPVAGGPEPKTCSLLNLVISSYASSNGRLTSSSPVDYLKYDPDGSAELSRPTITVRVLDADPGVTTCVVWLRRTGHGEWGDADPYMLQQADLAQDAGDHTFTFTWNGAYRPGGTEDEAPWGTYTYDVQVAKGGQVFWAKQPYLVTIPESITVSSEQRPGHAVWFDEEQTPVPLLCDYYLEGAAADEPSNLVLYGLDGDLQERGSLAGPTAVGQLHAGSTGTGMTVAARSIDEVAVPEWRVVFTAALPSASAQRRDHQAGRMLAVNALAGQKGVFQVWVDNAGAEALVPEIAGLTDYIDNQFWFFGHAGNEYERIEADLVYSPRDKGFGLLPSGQAGVAASHVTTAIASTGGSTDQGNAKRQRGTRAEPDMVRVGVVASDLSYGDSAYARANALLHELGHAAGLEHDDDQLNKDATRQTVMRTPGGQAGDAVVWTGPFNSAWGRAYAEMEPGSQLDVNTKKMRRHCGAKH